MLVMRKSCSQREISIFFGDNMCHYSPLLLFPYCLLPIVAADTQFIAISYFLQSMMMKLTRSQKGQGVDGKQGKLSGWISHKKYANNAPFVHVSSVNKNLETCTQQNTVWWSMFVMKQMDTFLVVTCFRNSGICESTAWISTKNPYQ